MESDSSRRNFLVAGLSLPVAGLASVPLPQASPAQVPKPASPGAAAVRYRTLGKTGLKVSTVGYGCMITSDSSVISRAVDLGITYFDTARGYQSGNNERMVGAALKGSRNRIVLSSKSEAKTASQAAAELDASLKELGTDHLDIWYMHSRDTVAAIPDELITVWENARQQGKILHIGISTHKPNAIVDRVLEVGKFEVVLSTYSFAVGTANDPAYKRLTDAGIGMVAMKVMAPAARARKPDGPLAALKWVLRDTRFATTVPSMTDMEQLEMNFRAMAEPFARRTRKCWRGSTRTFVRFTAACATSAAASAPRACRFRKPSAIWPMPISTGSSRWAASTSWRCRKRPVACAAGIATPARCDAPT